MEFVGYFTQWSIYSRQVYLKTIHDNGTADRLTILNYAFGNITSGDVATSTDYPEGYTGYRAFEETRSAGDSAKLGADANINTGDADADYGKPFKKNDKDFAPSIEADDPGWGASALMGNFNQLKQLKDKHPKLKVLVSLGGWTCSRNWSSVAATAQSRKDFVSSCIDLYIKGNLPDHIWQQAWVQPPEKPKPPVLVKKFGGTGVAKGIFDGIDIDWEWPGCDSGLRADDGTHGNKYTKDDKANFVELLKEFRKQLDDPALVKAYPPRGGKYLLTAFLPADPKIMDAGWNAAEVMKCLDFGNIQGYDFHGAWEKKTNQQSALQPPTTGDLSVETAVGMWIKAAGESARAKLTFGIPYYGRGWKNVGTENADGLGNSANGKPPGKYEDGIQDYRDLAALDSGKYPVSYKPDNKKPSFAWRYSKDDNIFWTYDDPTVVYQKAAWAKDQKLGGVMVYSLDGDDPKTGILAQNIRAGLDGEKPPTNGQ
ncbi:glycoside hydrolase family 18 protein [Kitasatospora sp. NPDC048298]|uniref:glycoside hydrolase family 18 protein n=1 Tax=Kitasatospora sp. NPDC048298 TaxID=3364049 RepID=UPI00371D3A01